jgi:hypothetical protein
MQHLDTHPLTMNTAHYRFMSHITVRERASALQRRGHGCRGRKACPQLMRGIVCHRLPIAMSARFIARTTPTLSDARLPPAPAIK